MLQQNSEVQDSENPFPFFLHLHKSICYSMFKFSVEAPVISVTCLQLN